MDPEFIDSVLERANHLLEAGKPAETLDALEELNEDDLEGDDRIEWATLRGWALSELGRGEEAVALLLPLVDDFPSSARLFGTLGVVFSNLEALDDARAALETAIALDSDDEVLLGNLALVYEKLRDYGRALEYYDRAIDHGADIDWALQRKAAAYSELGDTAGARGTLKRYLSLVPDDAEQWLALAILHSDDEQFEAAYDCYRRAEELGPDSPALRLNWGVTEVRAGRLEEARRQLDELRRIESSSARTQLLLAFIVEEEGDAARAQSIYEGVLAARDFRDHEEAVYAYEMAMDFHARHSHRDRCKQLLKEAYEANACTVELCEAYRELVGEPLSRATWFSLMIEADLRIERLDAPTRERARGARSSTFLRNYQVVARDRDHAVALVLDFARRMGERHARVREIVQEESIEATPAGIYEVEPECVIPTP